MEHLGAKDFEGKRLRRPGTWVVVYLADWCPFCRNFQPVFERFEGSGPFTCAIADVTDTSNSLWDNFAIDVVPTVIAFQDGESIARLDGISMVGLDAADLKRLRTLLPPGTSTLR